MKPTFLTYTKPLLTAMVQNTTPEEAICTISNALYDGADAFGIQLESLKREYRNEDTLRMIFSFCGGKPIYITSYRNAASTGMTDDECADYLLLGLKSGATLCDVMGDMFHPEHDQLTFDPAAVAKQKALIETIHERGGEVLISSHLSSFFTEDEIVRYAKAQEERGTDIVKIVSRSDSEDELLANLAIATHLKHAVKTPYLFLASGTHSRLLREIGPALGVCMYLCVDHYQLVSTKEQPKLSAVAAIRDHML